MNMRPTEEFEKKLNAEQLQSLDWTRSIAIRANAGSGKTTVLVQRIVQILHNDRDLKLDKIVAITFTRKAGAQLKQKLHEALAICLKDSTDDEDRTFWQERIDELPRCPIGTIDSLCHRLLKEAIEAGMIENLDPGFGILDGIDRSELLEMAIRRTEIELKDAKSPAWERWLKTQGRYELNRGLRFLLSSMVAPAQANSACAKFGGLDWLEWLRSLNVTKSETVVSAVEELRRTGQTVWQHVETARNEFGSLPDKDKGKLVEETTERLDRILKSSKPSETTLIALLRKALLTNDGKPRSQGLSFKSKLPKSPTFAAMQDKWHPLLVDWPFDPSDSDGLDLTKELIEIYAVAHRHFRELCREENRYDYNFLAQRVVELLADRKHAKRLTDHYRFILVDEFQDTNEQQWQIVAGLAGVDPTKSIATDKLMIVGDPLQSIYRFRQADPTVFERIIGLIRQGNKDKLQEPTSYDRHLGQRESDAEQRSGLMRLKKNYRSRTPLPIQIIDKLSVHAFDKVRTIPQSLEAGLEPSTEYTEVVYVYPKAAETDATDPDNDDTPAVDTHSSSDEPPAAEKIDTNQLELVAAELCTIFAKHHNNADEKRRISWKNMAILLRSRNAHLVNLEQVLQKSKIPYQLVGGLGFWQRQEVRDLVCLANCLANGADELALFAVLRGPLCGLDDSELLFLSMLGGRKLLNGLQRFASIQNGESDWSQVNLDDATVQSLRDAFAHRDFTDERKQAIQRAAERLSYEGTWRQRVDRMPHSDLLMMALDESGAWGIYTDDEDKEGERRLANLRLFFDEVRLLESDRNTSLADTARRLKTLVDESTKDEQAELTPDEGDAVQVMTVHAAKGLEFGVVAVIGLERKFNARGESLMLLDRFQHFRDDQRDGELATNLHGLPVISFRDPEMPLQKIKPLLHQALSKIERDLNTEEEARIFHVAITRAERVLILAGAGPKSKTWPPSNSWQKWVHESLEIGDEIKEGEWEIPSDKSLHVRIVRDPSDSEIQAPRTVKPEPTYDLESLRETPRKRTIAATALKKMLELHRDNPNEWAMRYRHHVQAHVGAIPKHLSDGKKRDVDSDVGKHVGTLVHRGLEMGTALPKKVNDRRALLVAHAAALINERGRDPDEPGSADPDASRTLPEVIAETALNILAKVLPNNPFKGLLEVEGEAEVDFVLPIGNWIITGRFDRLIRGDGDRWDIVDWKTDEMSADEIVEEYRPQMKLYALALFESQPQAERTEEVVVHLAMTAHGQSQRLSFGASELVDYRSKLESELPNVG